MNRSFYGRYGWPIMILLAAGYPLVYWGMREAEESSNNAIHQWLPQQFEETAEYEDFCGVFGTDTFALVSWVGCTLDDKRLEEFARYVDPPRDQRRPGDGSKWFSKVITGPELLETLTEEPFNLSRKVALKRLEGTLIGRDRETTCALVTLSEEGQADRTAALAALQKIAETHCGIKAEELRLGGDAVINAAIDLESDRAIHRWLVLSFCVALAIAWFCLRSIKLMMMIFLVAVYSSDLGTSAIHFTGGTMNLVLVLVPVLLYVLALSASVHLSNYYRDAVREGGLAGAPIRAIAAGWTPCALAAITTALGLMSLYVSHIVPVKMFGVYSALGIVLSLGLLFLLLPAAMEKWPLRAEAKRAGGPAGARKLALRRVASLTIRHRRPVVASCLALLVFLAGGVALIETTVAPSRFFSRSSKWVQDSFWLQERLGPMIPIEVVVRFDKQCRIGMVDRMQLVERIERKLRSFDPIGGTISPATFGPVLRRSMGLFERQAISARLNSNLDGLAATGYFHYDDDGEQLWRVSARAKAFSGISHDRFLQDVKQQVDAYIQAYLLKRNVTAPDTVEATYTGVVPLVYLAQRELLSSLFKSFCLAFVMIAVVMLVLLRNLRAGMLVMLPNVFPAVVTFGMMGWTGTLVDVGAMMTASVALGIAVDDTLHYLTWFRRALRQGHTRQEAIVDAFARCAPAMTQTTLIAGLGLAVFWLSSFQPVSQFGLLMFILLVAALIGDLVFLPALLATRLGRVFERERARPAPECPQGRRRPAASVPSRTA